MQPPRRAIRIRRKEKPPRVLLGCNAGNMYIHQKKVRLLLKCFLPAPPLRAYVRSMGIVHFVFEKDKVIPAKPYAPRPETSLYFFPRDPENIVYPGNDVKIKRASACVYGQHTMMNKRLVGHDFLALIVHLQPGVLHRLTGIPLNELTNTDLDAELVLTKDVKFVNEKLNECHSYEDMLSVVECFLTALIRQVKKEAHRVDQAMQYILGHAGRVSIDWLAKETCLCGKQFERKFRERMGAGASTLSRINRFNNTVKIKNATPELDWLSIGLQCGYYDYQHLVRDYKEFTGLTPTAYFALDATAPERALGMCEESRLYTK